MAKQRTPRTRNSGTKTEAEYFSMIRSVLRNGFKYWKPGQDVKRANRRKVKGKYHCQCVECMRWLPQNDIQIDHVVPCGSLRCYEDIPGFVERLTAEGAESYQLVCKPCHKIKTRMEAAERREARKK